MVKRRTGAMDTDCEANFPPPDSSTVSSLHPARPLSLRLHICNDQPCLPDVGRATSIFCLRTLRYDRRPVKES